MADEVAERMGFAAGLAREAGALAHGYFGALDRLAVERKGHQDVVSKADREVEELIRDQLARRFPEDGFVGEESGSGGSPTADCVWVVDPIDGTQCFLAGIPTWCVSIGLVRGGRIAGGVICDPNVDETFVGHIGAGAFCNNRPIAPSPATDFRMGMTEIGYSPRVPIAPTARFTERLVEAGGIQHRGGSGALGLAYVAAGRYLAYFEAHMNSWDTCAGAALIRAAGGWVNDILAGDGLLSGSVVLGSGTPLAPALRALAAEVGYPVDETPA